ncbi:hypothetical protein COCNU_scaffold012163G000010 [Cocos nucifera]|nr:hypothetical protein [Cocos nucifera]
MDSTREVIDVAADLMMEATIEIVLAIFSMHAIAEMEENLPGGTTKTMEVADPLCSVEGVKVVEPQGPKVPSFGVHPIEIRVKMALPAPLSSSTVDSFRIATEFLRSHLALADRATSGYLPLELVEVKGELDKFKYYLEQEKTANANLIKEIDYSEKALSKAQEVINRKKRVFIRSSFSSRI